MLHVIFNISVRVIQPHSYLTCNTESGFAHLIGLMSICGILFRKTQRNVNVELNDKKHVLLLVNMKLA